MKPKYYSTAKPYYRFELPTLINDLKRVGWEDETLVAEQKVDGVRVSLLNIDGRGYVFVDPEGLKQKDPNVSNRLPDICKELKGLPSNTILDGELLSLNKDRKEVLHRTVTNALLNATTFEASKLSDISMAYVFRILFYKGNDIRSYPLKEELEIRSQLKDTKHIHFARISTRLDKLADGYVCGINDIMRVSHKVLNQNALGLKHLAEGVMIKKLNHEYEYPTNKGWAKAKRFYECDVRVLEKYLVKDAPGVYNFLLGIDITKGYALKMLETDFHKYVGVLVDGKFYRGRDALRWLE